MLVAYIDEIGETGAFVARDDARYKTSPAFGYAGFIVPEGRAREFGAIFQREKAALYKPMIEKAAHPGRWERKGSDIFRAETPQKFPAQLRVFDALVKSVRRLDGQLFYYADEKPIGTPRQTRGDHVDDSAMYTERETHAMHEALNRIARYADSRDENVMVIIDQVNEKARSARLPVMYSHILGRALGFPEMRRIIEPPMHVDSVLSANIQFADWTAACVTRALDYQLLFDSPYRWVCEKKYVGSVRGSFTHESKLHLRGRSIVDLHHSEIFKIERAMFPQAAGQSVAGSIDLSVYRKIRAAAERSRERAGRRT